MDSRGTRGGSRVAGLIVVLGLALHLPSLTNGFFADDYLHQLVLQGRTPMSPWSLYDFGELGGWADLEALGGFPWWTDPDWTIRFFRPLTSLTLRLDHALYGDWAPGYGLTSLALYAVLLLLAHQLFRALRLTEREALVALGLFAASGSTAVPVGWPANRNTLLEVLFTVAAVLAVARAGPLQPRRILSALGLAALAALSKESGVVAFALVALCVGRRSPAAALASLLAGAAYGAAVITAGYGAESVFYATPWGDPGQYAGRLARLVTVGGLGLVTPLASDLITFSPQLTLPLAAVGVALLVPLGAWVRRRVRGQPAAAFLAAWLGLSILLQGSPPASDRLLLGAAVGSAGLLGVAVVRALASGSRALGLGVLGVAGLGSGLGVVAQNLIVHDMVTVVRVRILEADVGLPELGRREVFVLQAENALVPFAMASTWACESDDLNLRFWILQTGRRGLEWSREDERTFVFESLDRPFFGDPFESVYRTDPEPPAEGTQWRTDLFTVTALAVDEAGLRRIRVRLERAPDERFRFLVPRAGRLTAIDPPQVGGSLELPAVERSMPFWP